MMFSVRLVPDEWGFKTEDARRTAAADVAWLANARDGFKTSVAYRGRGPRGAYRFKVRRWRRRAGYRQTFDLPNDLT